MNYEQSSVSCFDEIKIMCLALRLFTKVIKKATTEKKKIYTKKFKTPWKQKAF